MLIDILNNLFYVVSIKNIFWRKILNKKLLVTLLLLLSTAIISADDFIFDVNVGTGTITQLYDGTDITSEIDESSVENSVLLLNMGFYGKLSEKTIFGFTPNISINTFEDSYSALNFYNTMLSVGFKHYLGKQYGSGLYLRGDVGASVLSLTIDSEYYSSEEPSMTDFGYGVTGGAGLALRIGGISFYAEATYSYRNIENEDILNDFNEGLFESHIIGVSVGILN